MLKNRKNYNRVAGVIFLLIFILFLIFHATPKMAVRSALFTHGHFTAAMTSEIRVEKNNEQLIYTVEPAPVEKATNGSLDRFHVKHFLLYFAEFGQA